MMGPAQKREPRLYYTDFNLERRVPADHKLRRIAKLLDFDFVRSEVASLYGKRGNPSVDPAVLLKFNFLLFFENVSSERKLMEQLPMRLDWLWFCGYDLDDEIPDHSVLSKARRRWGPEVFASFFTRVLTQCVEANLADGETVHIDASVIAADASSEKIQPVLRKTSDDMYLRLEKTTEPPADKSAGRLTSPTDTDARMTRTAGKAVLGYKEHRVVDDKNGIITACETTGAATSEAHALPELLDQHARNVGTSAQVVVADKGYGTSANYVSVRSRGMQACIPHERRVHSKGKYPPSDFRYDAGRDVYICPAGETLTRWRTAHEEHRVRYKADAEVCMACALRENCTTSKDGRRVNRQFCASSVEWADGCFTKSERRRLMARRKCVVEGSFADAANNHGFKRARWRSLEKMRIQNLLIAAIQNVRKLLRASLRRPSAIAMAARAIGLSALRSIESLDVCSFFNHALIFRSLLATDSRICAS